MFIRIWPEKLLFLKGGLGSSSIIWDWHQLWTWNFTPVWQLKKNQSKSNEESCRRLVSRNCLAKIAVTNESFVGQNKYGPFFMVRFNCLKVAEPLVGCNLLLTTMSPAVPITHLMELGRMKSWVALRAS